MENLQISIKARAEKRNELLRTCRFVADQTRQDIGCLSCRIIQSDKDESIIILEQQWKQRSLLNEHFRSVHFSALFGALKLFSRSYEVRINGGAPGQGMEVVQNARRR